MALYDGAAKYNRAYITKEGKVYCGGGGWGVLPHWMHMLCIDQNTASLWCIYYVCVGVITMHL